MHTNILPHISGESNPRPEDPPDLNCPTDYDKIPNYNDDCYKFATGSTRSWDVADNHCREEEYFGNIAKLTSVLSPYEQGYIFSVLHLRGAIAEPGSRFWIGLSDREVSSCTVYTDLLRRDWGQLSILNLAI